MMSTRTPIDHGRLHTTLEREAESLLSAASAVGPETRVPTCPGWTVNEVVRHVGGTSRAALGWLREGVRPQCWVSGPEPGQPVQEYFRDGLAEFRAVLAEHDPAQPAATWWEADRSYGFWCRRMTHEVTVHRVDVERAVGRDHSDIAEELAVDGVDEVLKLWLGHRLARMGVTGTRPGRVAVRAGEHTWYISVGPEATVVSEYPDTAVAAPGPGDGTGRAGGSGGIDRVEGAGRVGGFDETEGIDAVVSGSAPEVYLWLWGRLGPGSVVVDGDEDAAGQLWALLRLATR